MHLTATGLPPHVSILGQMKALQNNTLSTIEKIEDARQGIVKDIAHELEQRAIGAGTVTFDGLHDALRSCLAEAGVHDLASRQNMSEQRIDEHHEVQEEDTVLPTFFWAGRFRRVHSDFVLPDCSPAHLWVLWRCGNAEKRLPPLRLLDGADMPNRNSQKRLSDVRYLMKKVETYAIAKSLLRYGAPVSEAISVFTECASSIEVPVNTVRERKRRRGQVSWATIVRLHRIGDKRARVST